MKYAICPGEEFYAKMLQQCRSDAERAVVMLLWRTGMHSSTLVSKDFRVLLGWVLWTRPKTNKQLRAKLESNEIKPILRCIAAGSLPATQGILRRWLARIGKRAGYAEQRVSPLTFRHSRAVWLLDQGVLPHRVSHLLGCSYTTLEKHYAQLEASRLVG